MEYAHSLVHVPGLQRLGSGRDDELHRAAGERRKHRRRHADRIHRARDRCQQQTCCRDSITLAVASGPGALIGTTTATTNSGGNASFSVSINVAGSYTLQTSDTTTAITP